MSTPADHTSTQRVHVCELTVRGYELDSFRHVNHAVYISYLEHARWQLLANAGITLTTLETLQRWPVIGEIEVKYLRPTYMGDHLRIESRLIEAGRTSYRIEHRILKVAPGAEPTLVTSARIHIVTVNEKGRPTETPAEFTRLWEPQTSEQT
jgi:YbgC/YbaW family acyl-CoA thioester hydrolase